MENKFVKTSVDAIRCVVFIWQNIHTQIQSTRTPKTSVDAKYGVQFLSNRTFIHQFNRPAPSPNPRATHHRYLLLSPRPFLRFDFFFSSYIPASPPSSYCGSKRQMEEVRLRVKVCLYLVKLWPTVQFETEVRQFKRGSLLLSKHFATDC